MRLPASGRTGVPPVAEAVGRHIDRGHIYFAVAIEMIDGRSRKPKPVSAGKVTVWREVRRRPG